MTDEKIEKKVDEEWKKRATEEKKIFKKTLKDKQIRAEELPEISFNSYLASLSTQALIALGQMENPVTQQKDIDLVQGKYIIDLLVLLKEKTKGNLTKQEAETFQSLLSNLQLLYVRVSRKS
jgi:hypothetical protein